MSDLHLGFRGPGRIVGGRNQREMDVEAAWARAVDLIIARKPVLVTIAGDCFHSIRPSFHAVKAFRDGMRRLREAGIIVIVIGGNHEMPRTAETLTPNITADDLGIIVTEPGVHILAEIGAAVHCLPFVALSDEQTYSVAPIEGFVNILLIHAAVRSSARPGALPTMYGGPAAYDVSRAAGFDVVACGDFHEFQVLSAPQDGRMGVFDWVIDNEGETDWCASPLAFYSGSIERTSSNVWQEDAKKGVVFWDTDKKVMEFVPIETRGIMTAHATEIRTAAHLNDVLAEMLASGGGDILFRFLVDDFPRGERDSIDWALVAQLKDRCVHFHLDLRLADRDVQDLGDRRERASRTLADEAETYFEADPQPVRDAAFAFLGLDQPEVVHAAA